MLLREETATVHRRLEDRLTAVGLTGRNEDYASLLSAFLGVYRPLESAMAALDWSEHKIDISLRRKVPWLEADLLALGCCPAKVPDWAEVPEIRTTSDGFGVLYVMEGASLGGRLISRWLHDELSIGERNGGRFFSSYGGRVGDMWTAFLDALEAAAVRKGGAELIRSAAVRTFECFEACLAQIHNNLQPHPNR